MLKAHKNMWMVIEIKVYERNFRIVKVNLSVTIEYLHNFEGNFKFLGNFRKIYLLFFAMPLGSARTTDPSTRPWDCSACSM